MKNNWIIFLFLLAILPVKGQEVIDNRTFQTPVKQQGNRGTCTAFGVAAALEVLPGVPADISEQYLYGALKHAQVGVPYDEGDRLKNYVRSLSEFGLVHEEELNYNPTLLPWNQSDNEFSRLIQGTHIGIVSLLLTSYYAKYSVHQNQYSYYGEGEAYDPEVIKQLLRNGHKAIAVTYRYLHLPTWSNQVLGANNPIEPSINVAIDGNLYPYVTAKQKYGWKLMDDIVASKVEVQFHEPEIYNPSTGQMVSAYGGHAVTIVGYNEKGFIFKNSWGTDWGEKGYGFISYDAHKFMIAEALVFHDITFNKTKTNVPVSSQTDIRLKSTLSKVGNKNEFQLSIFTKDVLSDPSMATASYTIYDNNGKQIDHQVALANLFTGSYNNGFAVTLFQGYNLPDLNILLGKSPMQVVLEIGYGNQKIQKKFHHVFYNTNEYKASAW